MQGQNYLNETDALDSKMTDFLLFKVKDFCDFRKRSKSHRVKVAVVVDFYNKIPKYHDLNSFLNVSSIDDMELGLPRLNSSELLSLKKIIRESAIDYSKSGISNSLYLADSNDIETRIPEMDCQKVLANFLDRLNL